MSHHDNNTLPWYSRRQLPYKLGFVLVLAGYLMVWLPQPVAGLSFIGLEIGEWIKFLPQMQSGEIAANRNLFYLPPITLGLLLALWTTGWPNRRWQSWAMRAVAVLLAMLAFPAVEAILDEGADQWLGRVLAIVLVLIVALSIPVLDRLPRNSGLNLAWFLMLILAFIGLLLPTWAYMAVRPVVAQLLIRDVGVGPGVWLNGVGHFLIGATSLLFLVERWGSRSNTANLGRGRSEKRKDDAQHRLIR